MSFSNDKAPGIDQLATKRLISIDTLRGLVMMLMALDHTRDFFTNVPFDPTDLTQTNIPLFLTRWVSHLCAPTFIFLAGAAVYLYSVRRPQSKQELSKYLIIRGLWLVFLELTVVHFAWEFDPTYSFLEAGILWGIGWSMVSLAALIYLPISVIAAIGILLISGHNLLDNIHGEQLGRWNLLWSFFHEQKTLMIWNHRKFVINYPLMPLIGVMAIGYSFGPVFKWEKTQRQRLLMRLGMGLMSCFVVIRALNIYGDPQPWSVQSNFLYTILSFINCHKYPPSLLYLLITLGLAMLLLYILEKKRWGIFKPLVLFGQVPLFFYIVHIWILHLTSSLLQFLLKAMIPSIDSPLNSEKYGYDLPMIYDFWIILIIVLYFLCNLFMNYKVKHHSKRWLKYL